ncbi:ribonuclease HII [Methanomicrobium sp. W14]|uniref:ribonuclease HII n=1 Tax=Methanomicrobium sp. W14 TaxID=2817839 RepID=UPI001AE3D12D|nr:ribonuclease HII [Methanomicrobium sp. W14]
MICGIDEAGKGSVFGPMVIGGVSGSSLADFEEKGFMDSKKLTPSKREAMYDDIVSSFQATSVVIEAHEIDDYRMHLSMNIIVAKAHARAIDNLGPDTAYVDACDVNEKRYGACVHEYLKRPLTVISEHKADDRYAVVGAASIVAKVTRDRLIERLSEEYGDIGSGYPSDPKTIGYLRDYIEKSGECPVFCRKSWKTALNMKKNIQQKSILEYY